MRLFSRSQALSLACLIALIAVFSLPLFHLLSPRLYAAAGIYKTIDFQGKLVNTDGTNVSNGNYSITFTLYDASSGGSNLWDEVQTVAVADGLFQVELGTVDTTLGNVNFNSDTLYLGIKVGTNSEMTPRIRFTAVPYAFNAEKVSGLTVTNTTGTFTLANSKTLTVNNSLTFEGSDGTTLTFQGTDTYVGRTTTDTLTNKTIGSTGLTFSGATTDITTATNEDFVVSPNGTGRIGLGSLVSTLTGFLNINSPFGTAPAASISAQSSFAALVLDNKGSGDLFTASSSGLPRFSITNQGGIKLGTSVGTGSQCLLGGTTASWGSCGGSSQWSDGTGGIYYNSGNVAIGTTDPSLFKLFVQGTGNSKPLAVINGDGSQALLTASSSGTTKFIIDKDGRVGIDKSNPTNALLYIGSGTGSLTDNQVMGIKAKIDTTASTHPDAAQFNVNIANGASGNGSVRGLVSRVDVNDATSTGDVVALWGDTFVNTNSARNTWGINTYVNIGASSSYTGTAVGTEIGLFNNATGNVQNGGALHLVADQGTEQVRFGMKVTDTLFQHAIMIDDTGASSLVNAFYFGPTSAGSVPSGTPKFVIKSDGNVGIGVSPTTALHVSNSSQPARGKALAIFDQRESDDIFTASAGGTARFVIANSGNVGIGSTLPAQKLDVNGTINASSYQLSGLTALSRSSGNLILGSNSSLSSISLDSLGIERLRINGAATLPTASISAATNFAGLVVDNTIGDIFTASSSGLARFVINQNGSVGIGTTAPTALLHAASTSTALQSSGLGYFDWSPASSATTTNDLFTLNIGSNGLLGKILNVKDGGTSVFSISQSAIESSLPVSFNAPGDVAVAYDLVFTNPTASYLKSAAPLYLQSGEVFNSSDLTLATYNKGNVIADTESFMTTGAATVSGKLVVGTTTPTANLIGQMYLTNTSTFGKALAIFNQTESADIFTASGSGTSRFVIQSGGNIGVGTTAPARLFDLSGTGVNGGNGDSDLRIIGTGGTGAGLQLSSTGTGGEEWTIFSTNNSASVGGGALAFWNKNNSAYRMVINNTGNVGIGTTSPTGKLHLEGTANQKALAVINGDGNQDLFTASASGSTKFLINKSGNVGIGTTSPIGLLNIDGAVTGRALVSLNQNGGNQDVLTASVSGATKFTVLNSGDVRVNNLNSANCDVKADTTGLLSCGTDSTSGTSKIVVKGSDQNIASGTTLTSDTALTFAVGASETWVFDFSLLVTNINSATPDWKAAVLGASGWTCSVLMYGEEPANAAFPQTTGTDCDNAPTAMVNGTIVADANVPFQIHIQGTITTNSSGNVTLQWAPNTSGSLTVKGGSYVVAQKVGGSDLAETYYTKDDSIRPGDVVSIDSSIAGGVKKSASPYDLNVLGVVSTKPGLLLGDGETNTHDLPVNVALAGRIPTKVSTENGPIYPGDYLTSSSVPGIAMKATHKGFVIGQALGAFDKEGAGTVLAFVKNTFYSPPTFEDIRPVDLADVQIIENTNLDLLAEKGTASGLTTYAVNVDGEKVEKKGIFSELLAGIFRVGRIDATSIFLGDKSLFDLFSAKKQEDEIVQLQSEIASINGKVLQLEEASILGASQSAIPSEGQDSPLLTSNLELDTTLFGTDATVSGKLNVLGRTVLSDLGVTGDITSGYLAINGMEGALNTFSVPLKLQPLKTAGIDILNGTMTIDIEGNLYTQGQIKAKKVNIDDSESSIASIGQAVIRAGQVSTQVSSNALTSKSKIFATPDAAVGVGVKTSDQNTFTITLDKQATTDVKVNWWIVN